MTSPVRRCAALAAMFTASSALAEPDDRIDASAPSAKPGLGTFEIGAGYSPDDQFLAMARVAHPDLFGTGQRLSLSAEVSSLQQRFALAHDLPLGGGFDLETQLFDARRTYPAFARHGAGGAIAIGRRLGGSTRAYLRYGIEAVGVDLSEGHPARTVDMSLPDGPAGDGVLATIGAGIDHDTLDAPVLPTRGTRLSLYGERAATALGSDYELARIRGSIDHARPLGPFTLRLHGHAGLVRARGGAVPLAYRFHHAGHADVRGYGLDTGDPTGDNVEALGRAELELPVWKAAGISVVGWLDAGMRYNTDAMWGARNELLQRSTGFGLIWRSPIGPLRLDWALPLDGADRRPQFLFSLGGAF